MEYSDANKTILDNYLKERLGYRFHKIPCSEVLILNYLITQRIQAFHR